MGIEDMFRDIVTINGQMSGARSDWPQQKMGWFDVWDTLWWTNIAMENLHF